MELQYNAEPTFTLFVASPTGEVHTVRHVTFGSTVAEVKSRMELLAGLPASIYNLVYPDDGMILGEQTVFTINNIRDGFVLRTSLTDQWDSLYHAVAKNKVEQVYHGEQVHLNDHVIFASNEDAGKLDAQVKERAFVALYIASFLGLQKLVEMLVSLGTDVNSSTVLGRTALHAAAATDNDVIADILTQHGGNLNQRDAYNKTPCDIAQEHAAIQCFRRLRLMQLNLRGKASSFVPPEETPTRFFRVSSEAPRGIKYVGPDGKPRPSTVSTSFKKLPLNISKSEPYFRSTSSQSQHTVDVNTHNNGYPPIRFTEKHFRRGESMSASSKGALIRRNDILSYYSQKSRTDVVLGHQLSLLKQKRNVKSASASESEIRKDVLENENKTLLNTEEGKIAKVRAATARSCGVKIINDLSDDDDRTANKKLKHPKSVRFSAKLRYTSAAPKHESLEILRSMKRKIIVSAQNRPRLLQSREQRDSSLTFENWLENKKKESTKDSNAIISSDDDHSETQSDDDNAQDEAFRNWLENKKLNKVKVLNVTRPVQGIINLGSTEIGEPKPQEPEYNISAYRDWLTKRKQKGANSYRMKTMQDFMTQRKKLEEKRQKLLLSVISYEEWADFDLDKQALIRRIMKADLEELKILEEEDALRRAPSQITYGEWQQNTVRREAMEKHKQEIDQKLQEEGENMRREMLRSSKVMAHKEWVNAKKLQNLGQSSSQREPKVDLEKKLKENEQAFEVWLKNKHSDEIKELQARIMQERNLLHSLEQKGSTQAVMAT